MKNEKESNKVRSKKIGGELMKLSKYKKVSKISDDIYAVYNTLLMDVLFVEKKELELIEKFKAGNNLLPTLLKSGI